ncbi:cell division protein ZapA [Lactobacillus sp. UCMA15818]|uniref:cell division protein ZapA n=1 Tax=Lactobacillaceae TaxID=33958 RepID=UPI0025B24FDB|nr:cell division protein ZapA [Lactobacillus sp. UCMA15818]MDN2452883.1 cell division protein ZapA [Lactobacillus sp. UCMA15818]
MSDEKRRFRAEIAGDDYTIIGNSTDEHMGTVVKLVEEQFEEIQRLMPGLSKERAAVLLAINAISDQLYKEEEVEKLQALLDAREK